MVGAAELEPLLGRTTARRRRSRVTSAQLFVGAPDGPGEHVADGVLVDQSGLLVTTEEVGRGAPVQHAGDAAD